MDGLTAAVKVSIAEVMEGGRRSGSRSAEVGDEVGEKDLRLI